MINIMNRNGNYFMKANKEEKINLLISNQRNLELLKELLNEKFDVFSKQEADFSSYNLILLDAVFFEHYKEQIESYKKDSNFFTPIIFLRENEEYNLQDLFQFVEDVIELPVSKKLLLARVGNLIRNKRLWTENKTLKKRYKNIFNNINDMVFLVDIIKQEEISFKIGEANKKLLAKLNYNEKKLKNSSLEKFMPAEDVKKLFKSVNADGEALLTTNFHSREGEEIPVEINARKFNILKKEQLLCAARDITEKRKREKLEQVSLYDPNSGLPNSSSLIKKVDELIDEGKAENIHLIVLEAENYKEVMETIGHTRWGEFFKEIATQLKERQEIKFALNAKKNQNRDIEINIYNIYHNKLGFLVVYNSQEEIKDFIEELKVHIELPFYYNEIPIFFNTHLGLASYRNEDTGVDLMQHAYQALNTAVREKKKIKIYEESLETKSLENFMLLGKVRIALDENQFQLYYMPKLSLSTGEITGVEALIRWQHPKDGNISPGKFIPPVERTGLIDELTEWVINKAAQEKLLLSDRGIDINMAVNISPRNLKQNDFVKNVKNIIRKNGLEPAQFELELTETEIMEDLIRGNNSLNNLLATGFKISMDDFGTGYSSLAYLKNLDIDSLKIDLSFVQPMLEDKKSYEIVKAAIKLGQILDKKVVAEGIESQMVLEALKGLGCDYGQGYYIAKPLALEDFEDFYNNWLE